jgi:hypothetical protein
MGLGLSKNSPDFEITSSDVMNLDASGITGGSGNISSASLTVESIQPGEGFMACLGNTPGAVGTIDCQTITNPSAGVTETIMLNAADLRLHPVVGLTATAGDVLLNANIETFSVPEPNSIALLSSGFLGLAFVPFVRRRFGQ